jgi:hypothetical protein
MGLKLVTTIAELALQITAAQLAPYPLPVANSMAR